MNADKRPLLANTNDSSSSTYSYSSIPDNVIDPNVPVPSVIVNINNSANNEYKGDNADSPQPGFLRRQWNKVWRDGLVYAVKNPGTALKSFVFGVVPALASAVPTALYALLMYSGKSLKDASSDWSAWWKDMPIHFRALSLVTGLSSLHINYMLARDWIPKAAKRLYTDFWEEFRSKNPVGKSAMLLLALGAAIASSVMAFDALAWIEPAGIGDVVGGTAALLNLGIYLASRYKGMWETFRRIKSFFDPHRKIINEIRNNLPLLTDDEKRSLDKDLKQLNTTSNSDDQTITAMLNAAQKATKASKKARDEKPVDCCTTLWSALKFLTDAGLGIYSLLLAFPVFTQKVSDGIGKTSDSYRDLPTYAKDLISAPAGMVSAILYFISALDIRSVIVECWQLDSKFAVAVLLLENALACVSMPMVTKGVMSNPNNIIPGFPTPDSDSAMGALVGIGEGAFSVNAKSSLRYATANDIKEITNTNRLLSWLRREGDSLSKKHILQNLDSNTIAPLSPSSM